jgi:hypothetical protein
MELDLTTSRPGAGAGGRTLLRPPRRATVATLLVLLAASVPACGSSGGGTTALRSTCTDIGAVLSDGPDPDGDPVGYAEAQVHPLGQITTSDVTLRRDIAALADAYRTVVSTNGSAGAERGPAAPAARVDRICPGVTS